MRLLKSNLMLVVALLCIVCVIDGCGSFTIQKHKKLSVIMYEDIIEIGTLAKRMCEAETLKESNCSRIEKLYSLAMKAVIMYAQATDGYERDKNNPNKASLLESASVRLRGAFTNLAVEATMLGIEWRKQP